MSTVNVMAREIAVKIVFYGPGLSGKTTTLRKIYESVRPANRGEMMSLATEGDRTLFFDFLPVKVERVGDFAVRLALYTVPGQVFYNATRKLVLQGADGVVFVADSQPEAMTSNRESLRNLEENLQELGIRLREFPLVLQYNKRDLPSALPVPEIHAALNAVQAPEFETCAPSGRGVLDTLKAITRLVIKDLQKKKVVPTPPAKRPADAPASDDRAGRGFDAPRPMPRPAPAVARDTKLGVSAALAPAALIDWARAADDAWLRADSVGCVRACQEAVRRGLAFAGEAAPAQQALLLGVDGPDLLRLDQLSSRTVIRTEDAAFAIYVLMQVLARLARAGLPSPAP